jgi:opacity protein-like surface antigen
MQKTRIVGAAFVIALCAVLPMSAVQAAPANPAQLIGNYAVAIADHHHPAEVVTAQDVSDAMQAVQGGSGSDLGLGFNLGVLPGFPDTVEVTNSLTYEQECLDFPRVIGAIPHLSRCSALVIVTWESSIGYDQGALQLVAKEAQHGHAVSGAEVVQARIGTLAAKPTFLAGEGGIARFTDTGKVSKKTATVTICIYFSKWVYVSPKLEAC